MKHIIIKCIYEIFTHCVENYTVAIAKPRKEIKPPLLFSDDSFYHYNNVDKLWIESLRLGIELTRNNDPFWATMERDYKEKLHRLKCAINYHKTSGKHQYFNINESMFSNQTYFEQCSLIETYKFERKMHELKMVICESCCTMFLKNTGDKKLSTRCSHCSTNKLTHDKMIEDEMLPVWTDTEGKIHYEVPDELCNLRFGEQLLIANKSSYVALKHVCNGIFGLEGHCACFPQEVDEVFTILPRKQSDVIRVVKQFKAKYDDEDKFSVFMIRKKKVMNALYWLKKHNSEYKNISIKEEHLDWMIEEEDDLTKKDFMPSCDDDQSEANNNMFSESVSLNQTQQHSTLDDQFQGYRNETTTGITDDSREIISELKKSSKGKIASMDFPAVGMKPVSEYNSIKIFTGLFPWLFPGGQGDAMNRIKGNQIDKNNGHIWASKLLNYFDGRFMKDKTFLFYALDMIHRHDANKAGSFFMNTYLNENIPNLDDLKEKLRQNNTNFINRIVNYASKIPGSDPFWRFKRDEINAWIEYHISRGHGAPTLFMTLSCAEYWWPDLALKVSQIIRLYDEDLAQQILDPTNVKARCRAMVDYTSIVQYYFQQRVNTWMETVGKKIFKIEHYWLRYEFAKGCGQIHAHFLAITSNGYLLQHDIANADDEQQKINILSTYARNDLGMTANFPLIDENSNIDQLSSDEKTKLSAPEGTASRNNYSKSLSSRCIEITDYKQDQADLLNMVEMHVCNKFCMRNKPTKNKYVLLN